MRSAQGEQEPDEKRETESHKVADMNCAGRPSPRVLWCGQTSESTTVPSKEHQHRSDKSGTPDGLTAGLLHQTKGEAQASGPITQYARSGPRTEATPTGGMETSDDARGSLGQTLSEADVDPTPLLNRQPAQQILIGPSGRRGNTVSEGAREAGVPAQTRSRDSAGSEGAHEAEAPAQGVSVADRMGNRNSTEHLESTDQATANQGDQPTRQPMESHGDEVDTEDTPSAWARVKARMDAHGHGAQVQSTRAQGGQRARSGTTGTAVRHSAKSGQQSSEKPRSSTRQIRTSDMGLQREHVLRQLTSQQMSLGSNRVGSVRS